VDLVSLLVAIIVIALVLWLINMLPIDGTFKTIALVIAVVLLIVWLLGGRGAVGL
jgi:hypothetical protein